MSQGGVGDGRRSLESAHTSDLEGYDRPWLRRKNLKQEELYLLEDTNA